MALAPTNTIILHVDKFLQQESDHKWLMVPLNCKGGKDQFKNTVVYSTFPSNLNRDDFGYYIDTTFSDLGEDMRKKMKGLYITNRHSFQQEDIVFDYGTQNGKISASLLQIISQKNASNELEVIVGVISLIRTPEIGWRFNNDYWQSDKDRVKRGLQYIFGN
ncbi:unnamed protein product [Rotaria sordida]|uniref:Uncharacterized protein n=1 Tax=Rotaria sordida TaxID=392033 RepID=A0A819B252_9BILA|nr:unnamed protein product [Rotaria sordida]CAF1140268.1 unnamed protein product [Rotaria sordida]CAF3794526.1 unnamed protein product [Rotaria sordida]CAF3937826.1 unnamed protein product [Rotaria sordida]